MPSTFSSNLRTSEEKPTSCCKKQCIHHFRANDVRMKQLEDPGTQGTISFALHFKKRHKVR